MSEQYYLRDSIIRGLRQPGKLYDIIWAKRAPDRHYYKRWQNAWNDMYVIIDDILEQE